LECISRRASKVYFIEQREPSIKILTKNIKKLNCEKKVNLFSKNVFDLKKIKKIRENKFDLIFLDPPYKEKNINLLLNEINEMNILIEEGIIVLHKHKRSNDNFDNKFKILRTENYGISKVIFGKFI
jgi:16S rRNA (guanine966-N2)-methyltransferase